MRIRMRVQNYNFHVSTNAKLSKYIDNFDNFNETEYAYDCSSSVGIDIGILTVINSLMNRFVDAKNIQQENEE